MCYWSQLSSSEYTVGLRCKSRLVDWNWSNCIPHMARACYSKLELNYFDSSEIKTEIPLWVDYILRKC